jgi:hypothetical protein
VFLASGTTCSTTASGFRHTTLSGPAVPSFTCVVSRPSSTRGAIASTCPSSSTTQSSAGGLIDVVVVGGSVPLPGSTVAGSTSPMAKV